MRTERLPPNFHPQPAGPLLSPARSAKKRRSSSATPWQVFRPLTKLSSLDSKTRFSWIVDFYLEFELVRWKSITREEKRRRNGDGRLLSQWKWKTWKKDRLRERQRKCVFPAFPEISVAFFPPFPSVFLFLIRSSIFFYFLFPRPRQIILHAYIPDTNMLGMRSRGLSTAKLPIKKCCRRGYLMMIRIEPNAKNASDMIDNGHRGMLICSLITNKKPKSRFNSHRFSSLYGLNRKATRHGINCGWKKRQKKVWSSHGIMNLRRATSPWLERSIWAGGWVSEIASRFGPETLLIEYGPCRAGPDHYYYNTYVRVYKERKADAKAWNWIQFNDGF